ncbi:hypothetical protein HDU81_007897 [Chytriomyces hyalinus]|nr:hypothetical protein HDU81_007897 [Chytriomyces hyalinus]
MHVAIAAFTAALLAAPSLAQVAPPVRILGSDGLPLAKCAYNPASGLARLEPPLTNQMMLGMSLDWSYETPIKSRTKTRGYAAAVYNAWLDLVPNTFDGVGFDNSSFNWFGSEAGRVGAMLELTLNPPKNMKVADLKDLTPKMYDDIGKMCQIVNQQYGVPIFLRWAHEMNGDWYGWGNEPRAFIESWKLMTTAVRKYTNMTAMVWAPNIGITYPFVGAGGTNARESPARGGLDFDVLDSNGDGKINECDNPYMPFWPGDEYVDWVGLSLYYYPRLNCHNNCLTPADAFVSQLTAVNNPDTPPISVCPTDVWIQAHDFYQQFAASKNKPFMLPETGAPWVPTFSNRTGGVSEVAIKDAWYKQIFSTETLARFPKLKLAVNFEEIKDLALDGEAAIQDWRVTNNSETVKWWNGLITDFKDNLKDATQLVYHCDGSITFGDKFAQAPPAGGNAGGSGGNSGTTTPSKSAGVAMVASMSFGLAVLSASLLLNL